MKPTAQPGVKGFRREPPAMSGTPERVAQVVVRLRSLERALRRPNGAFATVERLRQEQKLLRVELLGLPPSVVTAGRELEKATRRSRSASSPTGP